MRKLIFLDMDGVIATPQVVKGGLWAIDPACHERLGRILAATGAEIVISSSWRSATIADTRADFAEQGFGFCDRITGITIRAYSFLKPGIALSMPRGVEIKQWIDHNIHSGGSGEYNPANNGTYKRKHLDLDFTYVILDDDCDMLLEHQRRFLRCESVVGLTDEIADRAIAILNCASDAEGAKRSLEEDRATASPEQRGPKDAPQ